MAPVTAPTPLQYTVASLGLDGPELEELLVAIDDRLDTATDAVRALLLPCRRAVLAELSVRIAA